LPIGYDPTKKTAWHIHCPGAVAMARGDEPDTAGTEFYISLQPTRYLDRNMTVFGRVVAGMEHVQALRRVAPAEKPEDDLGEPIVTIRVAADVPEAERTSIEILRIDRPAFDAYVEARRNRPEAFFVFRPDYVDLCQMSVPVRPVSAE
jgi:peptidylprolyl isomerase